MKKASANMWWIIIGAVIALVVLLVLLSIFGSKTRDLEGGLSSCESKGGICVSDGDACPGSTLKAPTFSCGSNQDCCIGVAKSCKDDRTICGSGSECREFSDGKFYCT